MALLRTESVRTAGPCNHGCASLIWDSRHSPQRCSSAAPTIRGTSGVRKMGSFNFNDIATQFYTAGTKYSSAIQPYAIKLFVALLLLDILVTWIQFTAEGQLDASHFLGRLIKHMLSGGFVYLMIVNAFSWMTAVVKSFSTLGAAVSGLPALSPQTVLQIGGNIASIIFNAPANASLMTNIELAIIQSVSAFIVLLSFVISAAMLLLTLIEAY